MSIVTPAYDPQTRTWFIDKPAVEARTLSDLLDQLAKLRKLPGVKKEWKITNYYQGTVDVRYTAQGAIVRLTEPSVISIPRAPAKKKPAQPIAGAPVKEPEHAPAPRVRGPIVRKWFTRHRYRTWDPVIYEKVLDMWAAGVSGPEIAKQLGGGLTPVNVSAHIVPNARGHGDPRAVKRHPNCGQKRRPRELGDRASDTV